MFDYDNSLVSRDNNKLKRTIKKIIILIGFLFVFLYYFLSAPFNNSDVIIHIKSNQSISSILDNLENNRAIRNSFTAKIFIKLFKNDKGVIIGDYLIKKNSPVWLVSWQLSRGKHNIEPIRITIKEGFNNKEIATLLASKFSNFQNDIFLEKIKDKQGYLFPDTYFFYPLDTVDEIIEKILNNFENKTKNLDLNQKQMDDIIIMASILEREAKGKEDISIISGILWKRISINMPLQVDVDRTTYQKKGLPLEPINNPGLVAIMAAINPVSSPYLYYLHDRNGKIYYAKSYQEHINNINKYLR